MYSLTRLSCVFICMIIRIIEGVDCYVKTIRLVFEDSLIEWLL